MKKLSALLLLSTLLAACSSVQGPASSNALAQFEAQVESDIAALERGSGLSSQAVAPFVYLNALKLPSSANTVRAYFKTTFSSPVVCTLDWGDNSAKDSTLLVPTNGRIETRDHAYAVAGSYIIKASCLNGTTPVGTVPTVSVQVGARLTGETRFYLDWGSTPFDLDMHLWLPASKPYHIYYGRGASTATCPYAQLDLDDQDGFGPEITRIKQLFGVGKYQLWVNQYSDASFVPSETRVRVEDAVLGTLQTINMTSTGTGVWWHVLNVDATSGAIEVVNTRGNLNEPYTDTASGCDSVTTLSGQAVPTSVNPSGKTPWSIGASYKN